MMVVVVVVGDALGVVKLDAPSVQIYDREHDVMGCDVTAVTPAGKAASLPPTSSLLEASQSLYLYS